MVVLVIQNMYFHNVHHKSQYCNFSVNSPLMDIIFKLIGNLVPLNPSLKKPYQNDNEYKTKELRNLDCPKFTLKII